MKLTATDYKKMKHRERLKSDVVYEAHLKFLGDNCNAPVFFDEEVQMNGKRYPRKKPYYKRLYRGNHKNNRYAYYKKHVNRVVRRYKEEIHKGGSYKKCLDYWWTVD